MEAGLTDHVWSIAELLRRGRRIAVPSMRNALPPQKEKHVTSYLIEYYKPLRLELAILVILSSIQSHSTTTVVLVSSGGIVVAVDSKLTARAGSQGAGMSDGIKVFSVHNRIAIVGIGTKSFILERALIMTLDT
jgi:hypothetical protein